MENIYIKNNIKKACNGCGVCALECPKNAIVMCEDEEGFLYPQIDEKKCIKCGKCQNICSNFNNSNDNKKTYMVINKNEEEKQRSASGGMFFVLAKYVLKNNGVVFGVEYDDDLKVRHTYYETIKECEKFQGSKYVRSDINDAFYKVKEFLNNDRLVLFTGTPCQCNGLKVYLKRDYENLIICDIICHANPSPKVFYKYVKEIEETYNKKVIKFSFRNKENGWKSSMPTIYFEDNTKINDPIFYRAFVAGLFDRPSCHECKFSYVNRVTDFTIGDFWGVNKVLPQVEDNDTGISLVLVNTSKAENIFAKLVNSIEYKEVDVKKAFRYNHNSSVVVHNNRQKFFYNLDSISIVENMENCLKISFYKKVIKKIKKIAKIILNKNVKS